eukprot:NODE_259_length_11524_cov_0.251028.p1 type:complete len:337 gc:universal NODE_259_length_11524_cov_0.251028:8499-7489(-)
MAAVKKLQERQPTRGECLNSLKHMYGCCKETARASIHIFCNLLISLLRDNFSLDRINEEYLRNNAEIVYYLSGLDGIPFVVDGTHFPIRKIPRETNPSPFYNRKGFRSMAGQVVVDAQMRIVSIDVGFPGSVNDASMFAFSNFKQFLLTIFTRFDKSYMLMGDNGYHLREYLITPYQAEDILRCSETEQSKLQFNRIFSSVRQIVERIFGILQRRYYILVIGTEYKIELYVKLILCCFMLHNYQIDNNPNYILELMGTAWSYSRLPTRIARILRQIDALRDCPIFNEEHDFQELALGEYKRDMIRNAMPTVVPRPTNANLHRMTDEFNGLININGE